MNGVDPSRETMVTPILPVAYSGAPGAYSHQAAQRFFGSGRATLTCESARAALQAVGEGRAAAAVLPVENTVTGRYAGLVEAVSELETLGVVGEVVLPIRYCLMAVPGARLDDLALVTSHASALSQCRDWLAELGVATRPSSDTGRAAEELSIQRDQAVGVLGSRALAERYGFTILAEGLTDKPDNRTRFYVFERETASQPSATRTAVLLGPLNQPRALKTLRIQLESHGASRTRSPLLGSEDGVCFLVEFDHAPGDGEEIAAESGVSGARERARVLGSWRP